MKRLAAMLLDRASRDPARAVDPRRSRGGLGARPDARGGRRRAPGAWLLWQAIAHVTAARWAGRATEQQGSTRPRGLSSSRPCGTTFDTRFAVSVPLPRSRSSRSSCCRWPSAPARPSSRSWMPSRCAACHMTSPIGWFRWARSIDGPGHSVRYQPPQNFADWQARQDVFAAMTATQEAGGFTVNENGVPRDLPALQVTAGYFDVYRAHPQLGRVFTEAHQSRRAASASRSSATACGVGSSGPIRT